MLPKYSYHPKISKACLIKKEKHLERPKFIFKELEVKVTIKGQQHLGAAIESKEFKQEYMASMINNWNNQLVYFYKIAETEPQAAYAGFIGVFKSSFTYFRWRISDTDEYFQRTEDTVPNKFTLATSGSHIVKSYCHSYDRISKLKMYRKRISSVN